MDSPVRHVVILGGGSAGWLTAAVLAAEHQAASDAGLRITLIESPDVATVGVGEGTWPTMRDTLRRTGVSETDFIRECDAAFKQGSKFVRWREEVEGDYYHHPFVLPPGFLETHLAAGWMAHRDVPFSLLTCFQAHLCEAGKSPKQFSTPEWASVANYAYHLDAAKLGVFMRRHCVEKLGVRHVSDHMVEVVAHENGDIAGLLTREHGLIEGDLFVDCSGMRALLIGQHYGVGIESQKDVLFNDRAIATRVPYADPTVEIACQTISTAQEAGWIWDIGLQSRRGIGHVYSSTHTSDEAAEAALRRYIVATGGREQDIDTLPKIVIRPGFRRGAWHRNCVAVGLSSGFMEPLEASSLVMVELAAGLLADQMPATRAAMDIVARRYNDTFSYRWDRIVDFLKLHYVLSKRDDSAYWRDNRRPETIPERLRDLLAFWRHQPPSRYDLNRVEEVFPSASYQFILYGMGFTPEARPTTRRMDDVRRSEEYFRQSADIARKMLSALPGHREMLDHVMTRGMPRI
ncbi:tryptophan halogenase family protein [Pseudoxanthomonas sp.]|uniref:tryptophan halogenase family protein n=1 Tax=Pseudoxanthomonas sp. TaxID=1871049 RepID=UPI0025FEE291|nr:tryptophan halogenase family protein [Pseudoxanthomonas sp.]